ncbi:MAG: hypothetical protein AAGA85_03825 [Bacteroidota bacterium]
MRRKHFFLLLFLSLSFTAATAQTTRDVAPPKAPEAQWQSTKKKSGGFLGISLKKKPKTHREVYEARIKQVAKDNKKEAKILEKPQYSDPTYFGHKKPPKKRPAHKMKYCKVCQIRH